MGSGIGTRVVWLLVSGLTTSVLSLACAKGCGREHDGGPAGSSRSAREVGDAASTDAGPGQGPDAGDPASAWAEFQVELIGTLLDGGAEAVAVPSGSADIQPARGFDVLIPVALTKYRVRLLDWTDRVLPSDDVGRSTDAGVAYRIDLVEPLEPGRTYSMVIDPEEGDAIEDSSGRRYQEVRFELKVRGEIAKRPTRKKPARRR